MTKASNNKPVKNSYQLVIKKLKSKFSTIKLSTEHLTLSTNKKTEFFYVP